MESRSGVMILAVTIRVVLALVMVSPLIVTTHPLPETFFPFVVGKTLWTRILIEIAFGLWVILLFKDSSFRFPRSWILAALGVYVLIALLATVFSVSPTRSMWSNYERMQGWVDLAHWFTFVILLASMLRTWVQWRAFLNFNVVVGVVVGLLSLDQFLYQLFEFELTGFLGDTFAYIHYKVPPWRSFRLDVTLGNPTYVGGYVIVNGFIAAALLGGSFVGRAREREAGQRTRRTRRRQSPGGGRLLAVFSAARPWIWRVFWAAAIVLDIVVMYISATRGPVIALALGALACGVVFGAWGGTSRLRVVMRIGTAAFAVLFAALLAFFVALSFSGAESVEGFGTMVERWTGTGVRNLSAIGRFTSARIGLEAALNRPVLGWGPENYSIAYDRYAYPEVFSQDVIVSFDQAHNKPIEEVSTKGLLGLAGYTAVWVFMLVVFVRKVRFLEGGRQVFVVLLGGALVAYFMQNIFLFDTPGTAPQFYALAAFVVFLGSLALGEDASRSGRKRGSANSMDKFAALGPLRTAANAAAARRARLSASAAAFFREGTNARAAAWAGAFAAAAAVVLVMFFVNVRTFMASTYANDAFDDGLSWEERFQKFEDGVDAFPPLGYYVRILMIQQIGQNWFELDTDDALVAFDIVDEHAAEGMAAEPEEWRVVAATAAFYRVLGGQDRTFIPRARVLAERAAELAPWRVEVHRMLAAQRFVEGDPEGALGIIDAYIMEAPETEGHFKLLRSSIESQMEQRRISEAGG